MSEETLTPERLRTRLREFKEQRGAEYHLLALGYFGSYARNEAAAESDVDIVFETDAPNLFRTSSMRLDLIEWLGRPVDIVRLRETMNPRLKARVEREAVYV
ncbi:MAG: nucleotidyltransferase domain-containing protein [Desulfuromonadales bacterium]|nr:nucleotidyltransferase domain-containing protein [Desulfuromonadales bacterium]